MKLRKLRSSGFTQYQKAPRFNVGDECLPAGRQGSLFGAFGTGFQPDKHGMPPRSGGGFTLMEIMISIAIIGILVLMVVLNVTASQRKGRDLKRKSDLSSISKGLEMYYNDFGRYPTSDVNGNILGCGVNPDGTSKQCTWGGDFKTPDATYMVVLPEDPKVDRNYFYESADGSDYKIYADLENIEDPQYGAGGYKDTNCSTDDDPSCTFGIASTNTTLGPLNPLGSTSASGSVGGPGTGLPPTPTSGTGIPPTPTIDSGKEVPTPTPKIIVDPTIDYGKQAPTVTPPK
jgi:prepilin-type N-terminal cleavage/methylation domain-containing protein